MRDARLLLMLVPLMLSACQSSAPAADTPADTSAVQVTQNADSAAAEEGDMMSRSLFRLGNTDRLNKAITKAQSGEVTTVAYIGGSITEGVGAAKGDTKNADCYAKLSYEAFAEKYGKGDNVIYVNAGESGTPSQLGNLRPERDVFSKSPDVVFVEFAVNDSTDDMAKQSYESLVRTLLSCESEPAVVLIINRLENGYSAGEHMKKIGEHYDLPVISVADAITPELDSGRMTWDDYSDDSSNPNPEGHKLTAGFIANMFDKAYETKTEGYVMPETSLYGAPFANAVMITPVDSEKDGLALVDTGSFKSSASGSPNFPSSWEYDKEGGDSLKFMGTGTAVYVIFSRNNSDTYGSFDVYLNGSKAKTMNTNQKDGWGEAFSEQVIKFQTSREMDIEIVPTEGSKDRTVRILGIGIADDPA